jgi:hypothetical protein
MTSFISPFVFNVNKSGLVHCVGYLNILALKCVGWVQPSLLSKYPCAVRLRSPVDSRLMTLGSARQVVDAYHYLCLFYSMVMIAKDLWC